MGRLDHLGDCSLKVAGLRIWVHARQFANAADYLDGNWLEITAICESMHASVRVQGPILMTTEIERFGKQCSELLCGQSKTAALDPLEPELRLTLDATDAHGHIRARVEITPHIASQHHRMQFEIDQSHLSEIIGQCAKIVEEYPVRGRAK